MKTSIINFPRIGKNRELKFAEEKYFRGEINANDLETIAKTLRKEHWQNQQGIDYISSNDFSFYDQTLDTAVLFNIIPKKYQQLHLSALDTYFAMARGYQGPTGDVKAFALRKWFNTNYHYLVPEFEDDIEIKINSEKIFTEFQEAKELGIQTKPSLIGPFTFLSLIDFKEQKKAKDIAVDLIDAYRTILEKLHALDCSWVQLEEPALVKDLSKDDILFFISLYDKLLGKNQPNILLQTYFGDVRDCYKELCSLPVSGIGIDFIEGKESLDLIKSFGFPKDKLLFAGLINGKNIWKNNSSKTKEILSVLKSHTEQIVLSTSCSLLHVPYSLEKETNLSKEVTENLSFAFEKIDELKKFASESFDTTLDFDQNARVNETVQKEIKALTKDDFVRHPLLSEREKIQSDIFSLPLLPTTTIGSFPQTKDVKANRSAYKKNQITKEEYESFNREKIKECIELQERLGLDVLVHGEYERNDMVEYFGESLDGFVFTEKAWVQSYGTRCVKPPIIYGDISRKNPITISWSTYAQSLTTKPVKGMLTGPITILNWSFPREDISLKEMAFQIALAIKKEVLDLEKNGIKIIQVDEAALREKLPLRKTDWNTEYLDWAIPAFRLVHSSVKAETQIHTHMCYSEFTEIIHEIAAMDPDVITFEASRSNLEILDTLNEVHFQPQVGPGVYDIHSPRIPSVEEIESTIQKILSKIDVKKVWVNPDCGLKTREEDTTEKSLEHLVEATKKIRSKY